MDALGFLMSTVIKGRSDYGVITDKKTRFVIIHGRCSDWFKLNWNLKQVFLYQNLSIPCISFLYLFYGNKYYDVASFKILILELKFGQSNVHV